MMCSRRFGILLKEESFIFLDLVHQRKKTTMLFVRLERPTVLYMYEPLFSLVQLKGANECTVVSDKIGFIVSLILISIVHLYLNCTKVHPLAVFITLMVHYNLFYLFILENLQNFVLFGIREKKKHSFTHYYKQVK